MKELVTIICVPCDLYWCSEIEVQLHNFRKYGHRNVHILIYEAFKNPYIEYWERLEKEYSDIATFYTYRNNGLLKLTSVYAPITRIYMLQEHFKQFPELSEKVILYMDSDVIFTKKLDFTPFLEDNVNYLSSTPYISAEYFESKIKDVYPHRLKDYQKIDVLKDLCRIVGVDKQVLIDNQGVTGGCQYILKNITSDFWTDCLNHCLQIRMHLVQVNSQFFANEDKGFQSWCSDMLTVLWNLWKRGYKTECPKELNFTWSSDPIEKIKENYWLHNAGISGKIHIIDGKEVKMFAKNDVIFRTNTMSFFDMDYSRANISKEYCSSVYLDEILSIKNPCTVTEARYY
jgi:hypothetical protein